MVKRDEVFLKMIIVSTIDFEPTDQNIVRRGRDGANAETTCETTTVVVMTPTGASSGSSEDWCRRPRGLISSSLLSTDETMGLILSANYSRRLLSPILVDESKLSAKSSTKIVHQKLR
jgi:hypothetical protein